MPDTVTIEGIIEKARTYLPSLDETRIREAYEFAKTAHEGQTRESGQPYIIHPLETANILLDMKPDEDSIIAAILHDVLEDTEIDIEALKTLFGEEIIPLLSGMEKLRKVNYRGHERQIENLRKMFLAMAKDIRVILIKLADRLHNMRTLDHIKDDVKRRRIAEETLSIYSPIASRLGIYHIKNELDTLSFRQVNPEEYERIEKELQEMTGLQEDIIKLSKEALAKEMEDAGIKAEINGRVKTHYSIYKKLRKKNKNYVNELYDIFAIRIIVDSEGQCYQTLGLVHKHWRPLSRRFKDFIANPKDNNYQSLHTTLIGLCPKTHNQPIEIQIRTKEMNNVAEYGIAAHWNYKDHGSRVVTDETKLRWIRNLVELHENLKSNSEFIESLNVDIFHDRIFVLTPKGDALDLPFGATPVDFAYAVHTSVGHRCKSAKVNGKIVPLDYKLKNGQIVEILTTNKEEPNRYWLAFAVTSCAQSRIKQFFNSQDRENLLKFGKDMINKKLLQFGLPPLDPNLSLFRNYEGRKLPIRERENLVERIGNGSLQALEIIKKAIPADMIIKHHTEPAVASQVLSQSVELDDIPEILITGEKGYKTIIASCCHPFPPDPIIGYITRGRGVTIHKQSCKVLNGLDESRLIRTSWSSEKLPQYTVKLRLTRRSRIGLLCDIANVFANNQLAIIDVQTATDWDYMDITAGLDNIDTLNKLIRQLEMVRGVFSVKEVD